MKAIKRFISCNQFIIGFLFVCAIAYASYGVIETKRNTQEKIQNLTAQTDSFNIKFNDLLPQVHEIYKIPVIRVQDSLLGKDTTWKWYPPEKVNMYCNKTCHTLVHIKVKIKT